MKLDLQDDVAVIVGGARGLGHAIGTAFADEGARVALVDRDSDVSAIAARLPDGRGVGVVADVTDYDAIRAAAARITRELGRCDHVVFAAGIGSGGFGFPFWEVDP